jgi:glucose/arabinose dehydrogenase
MSRLALPLLCCTVLTGSLAACSVEAPSATPPPPGGASLAASSPATSANAQKGCDPGNGGLTLPEGFCASVFADNLGHPRHLVVAPNGDVYVNTTSSKSSDFIAPEGGLIVGLRDSDHDGHAESIQRFGDHYVPGQPGGGTGIAVHNGALYVEADSTIVRYTLGADVVPAGQAEVVLRGLPKQGDHGAHPFAIGADGALFVNSGSATNACQMRNRIAGSRGVKPCPELTMRAGIWQYDAGKTEQVFSATERYATGLRNTVALAVMPGDNALYAAVNDRDQLSDNWPALYTTAQNNELPAEQFVRVEKNHDYGWPYCYFDAQQRRHVLAPEFGGDGGKAVGDCQKLAPPAVAFPAHWAPMAVAFYAGQMFPPAYQRGAFISFHGSWNRTLAQSGFVVAFVPFADGKPSGPYQEFARGFAGPTMPADPKSAAYRPMGVAVSADGALYVSDDLNGRVWKIIYTRGQ